MLQPGQGVAASLARGEPEKGLQRQSRLLFLKEILLITCQGGGSCTKRTWFSLSLVFQKDDPDDCPIELSKVQSVKVVAKKRRDRSLPRAFEIFTDSKTYVFKAKDEKNAEEWLQCINVAVAQAKERESREATTYL